MTRPFPSTPRPSGMPEFSSVLASWRTVRLEALQEELARLAPRLTDTQKDALLSRKALADRTREFKRQAPETQLEGIRTLLKAYQSEIDTLTARAKQAESAVLDVHGRLRAVPDPYPVFETLVVRRRLTQDQTATQHDTEQLRSQLNAAESERITLQQRCADAEARIQRLEQRDTDAAAHAAAVRADAEQQAAKREASLQRELAALQGHLRELRASHEQVTTQLLTVHASDAPDSRSEQLDTLVADLQRANERAAQAERRTALVRTESERARSEEAAVHRSHLTQLQEQIAQLEQAQAQQRASSAQLHAEAQRAVETERAHWAARMRAAEATSVALRDALEQRSDYDEIKRELGVLKAVEFGDDGADAELDDPLAASATEAASAAADRQHTLESHLVRRNHKLQDELATLRAALADRQHHMAGVEDELRTQRTLVEELERLAKRLEGDLERAAQNPPADESCTPGSAGLLPIVTSQRDRFRTRNTELEQELRTQLESLAELRGEIKRLQADNLAMYEKVRYLQNYGGKTTSTEMPYPMLGRSDAEDPYRARYEQSLHPFEAFRGREQSRAIANLSPVDRLLHLFTSAVLGNASMRLVFVGYAVIIHVIVFGMLLDAGHRAVEPQ